MSVGELAAPSAPALERPRFRCGWIAGPGTDLAWFIGGAALGYALFALHAVLALDMVTVWLFWFTLSNMPHFFGTYVRLYLDREERRRRPALAWGSLGVVAAGPGVLLVCAALYRAGGGLARWHRVPFEALGVFVVLWAYWHMVRQHYGFLALYRRKNQDNDPADRRVDNTLLYVSLLGPLAAFVVSHPDARESVGLAARVAGGWEAAVVRLAQGALVVAAAAFAARQWQRWRRREALNLPKILFFLALVPLYTLIGHHPATLTAPVVAFAAFVTVFHDVQYHAIVYNHQRNRCHRPGADARAYGLGALVTRSVWLYLGCAIGMGVLGWAVSCRLDVHSGCVPLLHSDAVPLFGRVTLRDLLVGLTLGLSMHHYFVDQFLWRPSQSAALRRDLGLGPAA